MNPEQATYEQGYWIGYWIGVVVGGLFVGALCGLLPFGLARWKCRPALGVASLVTCTIAGLILGAILALPTSIIFSVIIMILGKPAQ